MSNPRVTALIERDFAAVEEFAALNRPLSIGEISKALGGLRGSSPQEFIRRCRYVPWILVTVDRGQGYSFHINTELRALCELSRAHEHLGGRSVKQFFTDLRSGVTRRRKKLGIERKRRGWNPDGIVKTELIDLLNWVENELDLFEAGQT